MLLSKMTDKRVTNITINHMEEKTKADSQYKN